MSRKFTSEDSHTDWERIDAMQDEDIDFSDIPEITEEQMAKAKLRVGGKPVSKGKVIIEIDSEIAEYFKMQAGDKGYRTLINEVLKAGIKSAAEL